MVLHHLRNDFHDRGRADRNVLRDIRAAPTLRTRSRQGTSVTPGQFNDLGNLMLAFTMLWAYLSFSQFLIIWSGNIKDEIPWYMTRAFGGWARSSRSC